MKTNNIEKYATDRKSIRKNMWLGAFEGQKRIAWNSQKMKYCSDSESNRRARTGSKRNKAKEIGTLLARLICFGLQLKSVLLLY